MEKYLKASIPSVIALSPTMKCNYNCIGCYSRNRNKDMELTTGEINRLMHDADKLGVLAFVITGGEPLLRDDILPLLKKHRKLLFILITNGSTINEKAVNLIAESGNIITLVSIDGEIDYNDKRRKTGSYNNAINALMLLKSKKLFYGFATTYTSRNLQHLMYDGFIERMIEYGCSIGYFVEYVPCGNNAVESWVPSELERKEFRDIVLKWRTERGIILIQFPHDEYGSENKCLSAGKASFHINSQGSVEPCPFVPISRDNIRNGGLIAACRSEFLEKIRNHPSLLRRNRLGCALFENMDGLKELLNDSGD